MAIQINYLIDGIFPKGKVHIIAGPSGAGKTTFLFSLIRDWSSGSEVLGHKSNPEPYLYIALDRALDEIGNRIEAAGLDPDKVPHISILKPNITIDYVLAQVPPDVKVVFLDGFARLCPGGRINDYKVVSDFCLALAEKCESLGLTIFAVAHATKVKQGENFLHPRHRVLGSVAWGGFTSTLIFIDETHPDKTGSPGRRVEVLPRIAAAEEYYFEMNDKGGLVPSNIEILAGDYPKEALWLWDKVPFDCEFKASWLVEKAEAADLSYDQVKRLLVKWQEDGALKKLDRGCYIKPSNRAQEGDGFGGGNPKS